MDVEKQIDATVMAAALEMVETSLRGLADEVAKLRLVLGESQPQPDEHVCRPPATAPPYTIFRCPCGLGHRFYPATAENKAGWRQI